MPEILRTEDGAFRAEGENWNIAFDLPSKGQFLLTVGKNLNLSSAPASISGLSEASALTEKRRIHLSEDELFSTLNADSKIPFGAEPEIKREFVLSDHRLDLTTDCVLRNSMPLETINAGSFTISGTIKKIGIIAAPVEKFVIPSEIKWFEFADKTVFYESALPPLAVLAVAEDGMMIEISSGEDFWRWIQADKLQGRSGFRIESADGAVRYSRSLYERVPKDEELPLPGRNWRFSCIVSWGKEKFRKKRRKACSSTFDLASYKWEKSRLACNAAGKAQKALPCLSCNAVINTLKQWVRSQLSSLHKGDVLLLKGFSPVLCRDAAHLKRSRKDKLTHFTLAALLDFQRWAQKQLASSGAELRIEISEKSPFACLPSLRD